MGVGLRKNDTWRLISLRLHVSQQEARTDGDQLWGNLLQGTDTLRDGVGCVVNCG